MGDAVGDGQVRAANLDLEDTIDAVAPPGEHATAAVIGARDHADLPRVDREQYAIEGEIAKGGMGRVIAARDLRLGRDVAIKELLPQHRDAARRFEREARITARLQHPSIIHVYEAGKWPGGEPFYAMPRVHGHSLDKVVSQRPTLNERLGLVPHVIAVADALAYAHSQRVIHRDLKPSNVLIGEFGETVVIDWGLAKDLAGPPGDPKESMRVRVSTEDTMSGAIVGTPAYMPPEQARSGPLDERADVYAIGALLYKVLAGRAPYQGETATAIVEQVLAGPPPPLSQIEEGTPPDLAAIVAKAMARDPADRYASAGELAADLKRFETGQLVAAHRYTTRQLFWRWLVRHRLPVATAAVAIIVLAVVGTASVLRILDEKEHAQHEQAQAKAAKETAEAERAIAVTKRRALLEERGRTELLAGRPGAALAYLGGAVTPRAMFPAEPPLPGALGFMLAEAMRPYAAAGVVLGAGHGPITIAVAHDGKIATACGAGSVKLWPAATWHAVTDPDASGASRAAVRAAAWDPSASHVITGDDAGEARIWTGRTSIALVGHTAGILDVAWSRDGARVATASADGTARIWTKTGALVATLRGHAGRVTSVRFAPDGEMVATASDDGTAIVWNLPGGDEVGPLRGHSGPVRAVRWSPDGARVATASADGSVLIWNAGLGKPLLAPLRHDRSSGIEAVEWSHDGAAILTAGDDHTARIWQLPEDLRPDGSSNAMPRLVATLSHFGAVERAVWSADDTRIATAGADRLARVWDAASGQLMATFEQPYGVTAIELSPDATQLITGSGDGTARVRDLRASAALATRDLYSPVHAIAVRDGDGTVAVGTEDSRVTLWHGDEPPRILTTHDLPVYAVAFGPDDMLVTGGGDRSVLVWNLRTGAAEPLGTHDAAVRSIAVSADGHLIATATESGIVRLWRDRSPVTALDLHVRMMAIAFSHARRAPLLAGATDDGTLHLWDEHGRELSTLRTDGSIRALAFAADDSALVVGGHGDTVVHPLVNGALAGNVQRMDGPTGDVFSVAMTPDGSRVITAGADGVAQIWDRWNGKLLGTRGVRHAEGSQLEAIAVTPDGAMLWTGGSDHEVRAWDIHAVVTRRELAALTPELTGWKLGTDDVAVRSNQGGP